MFGKTDKTKLITTEPMTETEGLGKRQNIGNITIEKTPLNTEQEFLLITLSEMAGWISPVSVRTVGMTDGYTVIMTITPSRLKFDGSALPVTANGIENTGQD